MFFTGFALIVCGICFCCIRRCFRKRRAKDAKKGKGVVDLKSVQLLGSAYKEKVKQLPFSLIYFILFNNIISYTFFFLILNQVQPDMDELTENAEDIAEEGEKKEEIKLGRLQYKVLHMCYYFIICYYFQSKEYS